MRRYFVLELTFVIFASFACYACMGQQNGGSVLGEIIPIVFNIEESMFPPSWHSEEINARAEPLAEREVSRSEQVIRVALCKYPDRVLRNNLSKVYVLHAIEFYGMPFGGTNSSDMVYISNQGEEKGYSDIYLEQTFHHEFSSILLRNYPDYLDQRAWERLNPKGFKYGEGGVEALRKGDDSLIFDESLNERGFLNQYALSDFENDFNTIVEYLFKVDEGFWVIMERNSSLKGKVMLAIDFYHQIDPKFTLDYFKEVSSR